MGNNFDAADTFGRFCGPPAAGPMTFPQVVLLARRLVNVQGRANIKLVAQNRQKPAQEAEKRGGGRRATGSRRAPRQLPPASHQVKWTPPTHTRSPGEEPHAQPPRRAASRPLARALIVLAVVLGAALLAGVTLLVREKILSNAREMGTQLAQSRAARERVIAAIGAD